MSNNMHNAGLRLGVILGLSLLIIALLGMFLGVGMPVVELLGSLYIGFAASFMGALIGFSYGLLHGYVVGAIAAHIVDRFGR